MSIGTYSMYRLTDVLQIVDGRGRAMQPPFIDLRPRVEEEDGTDHFITIGSKWLTWGLLGLKHLTHADYWWVIADLSGVIDPFEELEVDAVLRCPSQSRFMFTILPGDV